MKRVAGFVAVAFAMATLGACGDVAPANCEARATAGTCDDEARCVWLSPAPKGCSTYYDGRPSACFERDRTGAAAVRGPYETKYSYWVGCSMNDELDLGTAAWWDVRRH
jgi:hypothetical protein